MCFFLGKTMNHKAGSLQLLVENLVKTWEMEASHFKVYSQWNTIDHAKYSISANGGLVSFELVYTLRRCKTMITIF